MNMCFMKKYTVDQVLSETKYCWSCIFRKREWQWWRGHILKVVLADKCFIIKLVVPILNYHSTCCSIFSLTWSLQIGPNIWTLYIYIALYVIYWNIGFPKINFLLLLTRFQFRVRIIYRYSIWYSLVTVRSLCACNLDDRSPHLPNWGCCYLSLELSSSQAGRSKTCWDFPGFEKVAYCAHRFAAPEALSHCLSAEQAPGKES